MILLKLRHCSYFFQNFDPLPLHVSTFIKLLLWTVVAFWGTSPSPLGGYVVCEWPLKSYNFLGQPEVIQILSQPPPPPPIHWQCYWINWCICHDSFIYICTVVKIYTLIFSSFRKCVFNLVSLVLWLVTNQRHGIFIFYRVLGEKYSQIFHLGSIDNKTC